MRSATNRRLDDLASLLTQVRFSHDHADYKESRAWRIFAYPRKGKADRFDALVCVIPRRGPEELGAELRLTIHGNGSFWLARESTNRKGQVWFHDLPRGEYSPRLGSMPLSPSTDVAANVRVPSSGAKNVNRAGRTAWPSYVLEDRRISAALRMEKSGLAVLTWRALEPQLAGVRIAFQLAGESGEVVLNPKGRSTRPSARWLLQQAFRDIAALLPHFTIKGRRAMRRT